MKTLKVLANHLESERLWAWAFFANPFRVAEHRHHIYPGCHPGLELANAFGVVP